MQEIVQNPSWSWPAMGAPMVQLQDASSTVDDKNSDSNQPPEKSSTPIHKSRVRPDDQGIHYDDEGGFWPVVVLRDEMVPNLLRVEHNDVIIPVLFMSKNDIQYVSHNSIEKLERPEFYTLLCSNQSKGKELLLSALSIAYEEREPMDWLAAIRKEWGPTTTDWDFEMKEQNGSGRAIADESATERKRIRTDHDHFSSVPFTKRQKPNVVLFNSDNEEMTGNVIANKSHRPKQNSSAPWTTEEDAELIRARERIMPNAPWADVFDHFSQRFDDSDRSYSSITSRYSNLLQLDAPGGRSLASMSNGPRVRKEEWHYLDKKDNDRESRRRMTQDSSFHKSETMEDGGSKVDSVHSYDPDEAQLIGEDDDELIRSKEHDCMRRSRDGAKHFSDKFPCQWRSVKDLRDRYNHYLQRDAYHKYDVAESEEQRDELRCMALSLLDDPNVQPDHGETPDNERKSSAKYNLELGEDSIEDVQPQYGQRWTAEEDAVLVWLKETKGEGPQRIAQLLHRGFPSLKRTACAVESRYIYDLKPEAWKGPRAKGRFMCEKLRACALSLQEELDPSIYYDNVKDDQDIPSLSSARSKMPGLSHVASHNRDENDEIKITAPLFEHDAARSWTAEEDANLIQLREKHLIDASWSARHSVWTKVMPQYPRTQKSLESRYTKTLLNGAGDNPHNWYSFKECQELRDRAIAFLLEYGESKSFAEIAQLTGGHQLATRWSVKEDALLLWIREEFIRAPDWARITESMQKRSTGCTGTSADMMTRYMKYLAVDAPGEIDSDIDPSVLRDQAQEYLGKLKALDARNPFGEVNHAVKVEVKPRFDTSFSIEEDAELIRLKERVTFNPTWPTILESYKQKFPSSDRSQECLRDRYCAILQESQSSSRGCVQGDNNATRQRALSFLNKTAKQDMRGHKPKSEATIISLLSSEEDVSELGIDGDDDTTEESELDESDGDALEVSTHMLHKGNDIIDTDDEEAAVDEESDEECHGDTFTFLIGEEQQHFRVPITRVLGNVYIIEDIIEDDQLGAIVTGFRWSRLKTEAFRPVYEYFKYADYRPRIKGSKLVGLGDSTDEHSREIIRCGQVFKLARELQIEELMGLVCQKFALLRKSSLPVLMTARTIFKVGSANSENDRLLRRMLTDEVANNFQRYMEEQAKYFFALKVKAPQFWKEVFRKAWTIADMETSDDFSHALDD